MKFKIIFLFFSLLIFFPSFSQITRIYEIQGNTEISPYLNQYVNTEGLVTLCLFGENQLNGFFIQDTISDNDIRTSDGIFVYGYQNVKQGDYISLRAKVLEYYDKTELNYVTNLQIISSNNKIPYLHLKFPQDFINDSIYERYEGMAICLDQSLYLTSNSDLQYSGTLVFSSKRLRSPSDIASPLSEDYQENLAWNEIDCLLVDDASDSYFPNPIPFLDENGTRRTGEKIDSLKLVLDYAGGQWRFYPNETLNFYGNNRSIFPPEPENNYDLKLCSFNLENYANESALQKTRIIKTLKAIDADIFGLCEVKQGEEYILSIVDSLNTAISSNIYSYINLEQANSIYTSTQIIYKKTRVTPINNPNILNTVGPINRKISQAFLVNNSEFLFVFSVNHLKAKSGTGTGLDADQNDGQSVFNYTRKLEAEAIVDNLEILKNYYNTDKVIVMGDLNSFNKEDPIEIFRTAGYENQVAIFDSTQYSYCYKNNVEYLDYALANDEFSPFVTFATNWHINADEPSFLDWENCNDTQDFIFRSSDHDPVIVFVNICQNNTNITTEDRFSIFPNPVVSEFSFLSPEKTNEISFYTIEGQLIKTLYPNSFSEKINIDFLKKGVYLLEILDAKGNKKIKKILKMQ